MAGDATLDASGFIPPLDSWFYKPETSASNTDFDLRYIHRRMQEIHLDSVACIEDDEYEVAWNEAVERPLLRAATDGMDNIQFANL